MTLNLRVNLHKTPQELGRFEFVDFSGPDPDAIRDQFKEMGFRLLEIAA
ncbi:hypothetical protein [Yoonia sp. I 8.24]|nr:hypothetical protein [Yoonia sp. I 8.24]MCG3269023.1 hypothetical protein [Yoonia sp. I 8.24]